MSTCVSVRVKGDAECGRGTRKDLHAVWQLCQGEEGGLSWAWLGGLGFFLREALENVNQRELQGITENFG